MTAEGISSLANLKQPGTQEHAEKVVEYFEWLVREFPMEIWSKGLATAREWLRLTSVDRVSPVEFSALLDAVYQERYSSHGWTSLAAGAYEWSRSKCFSVPPRAVFFALPDDEYCSDKPHKAPKERARLLLETFHQFHQKDPVNEAWRSGVDAMREWLRLIAAQKPDQTSVAALGRRVREGSDKYYVRLWGNAALGVWTWCIALGFIELVPESFRSLHSALNADGAETNHAQ